MLPLVLVGLGVWQLWPLFVEYRGADEFGAMEQLRVDLPVATCGFCKGYDDHEGIMTTEQYGYQYRPVMSNESPRIPEGDFDFEECRTEHHLSIRGYCAYPIQYDWRHRSTFIADRDGFIFSVDNGGKPVTEWPTDAEIAERFTEVNW